MKLRLLPIVLIASLLLFAAKAIGLIEETQQWSSTFWIADLSAKTAEETPISEDTENEDISKAEAEADTEHPSDTPPETNAPAPAPSQDSAQYFSPEEVDILTRLSQRREALEKREQNIMLRETALQATEQKINQKLSELKGLHIKINDILSLYNEKEDEKIRSLVKIYENMKPKDAAKIFEKMELSILLEVISKMKEAKAAPILAKMTPISAKELTIALAKRRRLPPPEKRAP